MAIGTALLVIFGLWLLVTHPRAVFRIILAVVGVVAVVLAVVYISEERDRPRREQEAAARQAQLAQQLAAQRAAKERIATEEATLVRDRETYRSADRWIGVAVDTNHCRYLLDLETMEVRGDAINAWIKVERPTLEPGVYLSENCYDYGGPRQVFFSCVSQYVGGAWSFAPGMISEDVLRWMQRSPWCAKTIEAAAVEQERQRKAAALARQAEQERQAEWERQQKALTQQRERIQAEADALQRRLWQNAR